LKGTTKAYGKLHATTTSVPQKYLSLRKISSVSPAPFLKGVLLLALNVVHILQHGIYSLEAEKIITMFTVPFQTTIMILSITWHLLLGTLIFRTFIGL
jgi:hypothetical protein